MPKAYSSASTTTITTRPSCQTFTVKSGSGSGDDVITGATATGLETGGGANVGTGMTSGDGAGLVLVLVLSGGAGLELGGDAAGEGDVTGGGRRSFVVIHQFNRRAGARSRSL
jgi:hypothetical protein